MRAKISSTTVISRSATAAVAANARLCSGPENDRKDRAALNAHRKAMTRLTATPALNLADLQQKGLALETAVMEDRNGMSVMTGDFGLTASVLRDLRNLTCRHA